MNPPADLQSSYDEILRKIGRNLLLFQQAEQLIKSLISLDSLSIHSGESALNFEERASFCHKMTMGQLAKIYIERICSSQHPADPDPEPKVPCHHGISISMNIRLDGIDKETRRKSFANLIEQRNYLVHHLLQRLHPVSPENLLQISDELDTQRREILPEILRIKQDYTNARSSIASLLKFLAQSGCMSELLQPEIQQSPLIHNLAHIAGVSADPEGWTSLREATRKLEDFPSSEILKHCAQFHQKSLSALLQASGLFEIRQQEVSETSHGRTFYRLKSDSVNRPLAEQTSTCSFSYSYPH